MIHRFLRGRNREVNKAAHLAGFLLVDKGQGIEVFHLGREAYRMSSEIKGSDLCHAAATGEQALPDSLNGVAHSTDEPQPCDNHSALVQHLLHRLLLIHCYLPFWVFSM